MGSFNVACSISNISIGYGTPTVFIPLEANEFGGKKAIADGNFYLISLYAIYNPVTLPIFGVYDDYGRIDEIEKDANVEVVEAFFGTKIESICDIDETKEPISSGMFIIREIYDAMIKNPINEWGGKKGFEVPNKSKNIKGLKAWKSTIDQREEFDKDYIKIMGKEINLGTYSHIIDAFPMFRNYNTFCNIYAPQVKETKLFNELSDFAIFTNAMYATNNNFMPAMNGCQFGNYYMSKKLYLKSLEIVKRIIKEREAQN